MPWLIASAAASSMTIGAKAGAVTIGGQSAGKQIPDGTCTRQSPFDHDGNHTVTNLQVSKLCACSQIGYAPVACKLSASCDNCLGLHDSTRGHGEYCAKSCDSNPSYEECHCSLDWIGLMVMLLLLFPLLVLNAWTWGVTTGPGALFTTMPDGIDTQDALARYQRKIIYWCICVFAVFAVGAGFCAWASVAGQYGASNFLWAAIGLPASALLLLTAFPIRKLMRVRKFYAAAVALEFLTTILEPPTLSEPTLWRRLEDAVRYVHRNTNMYSSVEEVGEVAGSASAELEVSFLAATEAKDDQDTLSMTMHRMQCIMLPHICFHVAAHPDSFAVGVFHADRPLQIMVAGDQSIGMLLFEACHQAQLPLRMWDRMAIEFVGACVDRPALIEQVGIIEGAELQLTETSHHYAIAPDQLQLWDEWLDSKAPLRPLARA